MALEVIPLPWPAPKYIGRQRLPTSYANFYIVNGGVIVPTFGDAADAQACEILATCFPDREIVPLPADALAWDSARFIASPSKNPGESSRQADQALRTACRACAVQSANQQQRQANRTAVDGSGTSGAGGADPSRSRPRRTPRQSPRCRTPCRRSSPRSPSPSSRQPVFVFARGKHLDEILAAELTVQLGITVIGVGQDVDPHVAIVAVNQLVTVEVVGSMFVPASTSCDNIVHVVRIQLPFPLKSPGCGADVNVRSSMAK